MKRSAIFVCVLNVLVIGAAAQAGNDLQSTAGRSSPSAPKDYPAPVNLKVLPRNLTGRQVHEIMEQWSGELGVRCVACHAKNPEGVVPGGPISPRKAEDTKQMKEVARLMYTMTEQINVNFIAKVEGSGIPVTCGTCHRGNVSPEPFVAPPGEVQTPTPVPPAEERRVPK